MQPGKDGLHRSESEGRAFFPGPPELAIREVGPFHPLVAGTAEIGIDPRLPEYGILRGTT